MLPMSLFSARPAVTGLIIAGGLARRMGGADKGLQLLGGRPLLAHIIERLAPQVDALLLNANHHTAAYAGFDLPLVSDVTPGYAGPLAGLQAGLQTCTTPLLACVPCDAPLLPTNLVDCLWAGLAAEHAELAVVVADGRQQAAFMLCRREVLRGLSDFLNAGERKVGAWLETLKVARVDFADAAAFANINTLEELQILENS